MQTISPQTTVEDKKNAEAEARYDIAQERAITAGDQNPTYQVGSVQTIIKSQTIFTPTWPPWSEHKQGMLSKLWLVQFAAPEVWEREEWPWRCWKYKVSTQKNVSAMDEINRKDMLPMGQGWILFAVIGEMFVVAKQLYKHVEDTLLSKETNLLLI
jgi:hypothetical protein